jgi:hypothetical protein
MMILQFNRVEFGENLPLFAVEPLRGARRKKKGGARPLLLLLTWLGEIGA